VPITRLPNFVPGIGQHDALGDVDLVAVLARADAHAARAGERAVAL
jgi:hypothetical protein